MFENIGMIRMARALTAHAAERQTVIARNIANSDTPGFRSGDIEDFSISYRDAPFALRQTRTRHLPPPQWQDTTRRITVESGMSPNGNSVSLEEEMVKLAETRRGHELSIGIYRSALNLMRTSIGRRN